MLSSTRPGPSRRDARGRGRAVVELDPVAQRGRAPRPRLALDLGFVDLLDLVARVRQPVRELAVVGEQQRAGRVGVEPADRDDARRMVDQLDDGAPALRVARGRDGAGRLVQEHIGERLQLERRAVQLDPVAALDERVQLPRLAVDGHAAGLDQLVGAAARGNAGPGEVGVEAHRRDGQARCRTTSR